NAPAADKASRECWEIETIPRYIPKEGTGQRQKDDTDALTKVDIIVKSKTYTRDDWVRMKTYATFIKALHNRSLTRLIAMYLHFSHAVSYRAFYDDLIEGYFGQSPLYQQLMAHFQRFLTDPEDSALEDLAFEQFPEYPLYFEPGR